MQAVNKMQMVLDELVYAGLHGIVVVFVFGLSETVLAVLAVTLYAI